MSPKEKDLVTCPKCGKPCWQPGKVRRTGKNPLSTFWYLRYKHPKRYGRNEVHYVRVDAEKTQESNHSYHMDTHAPLPPAQSSKSKRSLHTVKEEAVSPKVPITLEEDKEASELEKVVELKLQEREKGRRLKSLEG